MTTSTFWSLFLVPSAAYALLPWVTGFGPPLAIAAYALKDEEAAFHSRPAPTAAAAKMSG